MEKLTYSDLQEVPEISQLDRIEAMLKLLLESQQKVGQVSSAELGAQFQKLIDQ